MAVLTVQNIVPAGAVITPVAAAGGGDLVPDDGNERTFLRVVNGGGAPINVTIAAVETSRNVPGIGTVTVASQVVAVANGTTKDIGPFASAFRNASGQVAVSYSGVTSVTVAAIKLGRASNA
jgi:hypothetical protein